MKVVWWQHIQFGQSCVGVSCMPVGCEYIYIYIYIYVVQFVGMYNKLYKMHGT